LASAEENYLLAAESLLFVLQSSTWNMSKTCKYGFACYKPADWP